MIKNYSMLKSSRGQASLEYMAIFAIGFVLVAMIGGLFFSYTSSTKDELDVEQINKIGTELVDDAQKIYFLGDTNRRTYKTTFPQGIEAMSIHHINQSGDNYFYLNFTLLYKGDRIDLIFQTDDDYVPLKCVDTCLISNVEPGYNISYYNSALLGQGVKNIRIEAKLGDVFLEFIE